MKMEVDIHVLVRDGELLRVDRYGRIALRPVHGLYVDPTDGILRYKGGKWINPWKLASDLRWLDGNYYRLTDEGIYSTHVNHKQSGRYDRKIIDHGVKEAVKVE